jgi:kynureninase
VSSFCIYIVRVVHRCRHQIGTNWGSATAFTPADGARGFQVSSPSILDITALTPALNVFAKSDMATIAKRSRKLTAHLEFLMEDLVPSLARDSDVKHSHNGPLWTMITPRDAEQRGAMLSLRWHDTGVLERVVQRFKDAYVIVDIRKPDIMRITPSPLYTSFEDVWRFAEELRKAIQPELVSGVV